MFECTQIALKETVRELRRYDVVRVILTQIIYFAHTIYQIVNNCINGFKLWYIILYGILSLLTLSYLTFFCIITDFKEGTVKNKYCRLMGKILKNIKRVVRIYSLIMAISAVTSLYADITPLSIILTALMVVAFILQIVFEILIKVVCVRCNYILEGIKADVNLILTPINKVLKVVGKDFETAETTVTQRKLMLKAEKLKKEKKQDKKERKSQIKKEKKLEKKLKRKAFFEKINIFKKKNKNKKTTSTEDGIFFIENDEDK